MEALPHGAIHSILRLPPNTFSRKLSNSMSFCSNVNPLPIMAYCSAIRYRFDVSEAPYLIQLKEDFFSFIGDNSPLVGTANIIPHGGMLSPSILQCLHDTLSLNGYMQNVYSQIEFNPAHSWILSYPISSLPVGSKGVQSSVLAILAGCEMCDGDVVNAVQDKLKVSLGADSFDAIRFQEDWLPQILQTFTGINSYLSMCWLKAVGGGWTTSIRMHESVLLPCIFGCLDCRDEFRHYFTCPILWQLAKEALNLMETSFDIGHRLCLTEVNINRVRLLGYCHSLYHHIRSSPECSDASGNVRDSRFIQSFASKLVRAIKPLISDNVSPDSSS